MVEKIKPILVPSFEDELSIKSDREYFDRHTPGGGRTGAYGLGGGSSRKGVVGGGLLGPAAPLLVGVHDPLLRSGNHEVDDAGGATGRRR